MRVQKLWEWRAQRKPFSHMRVPVRKGSVGPDPHSYARGSVQAADSTEPRASASGPGLNVNFRNLAQGRGSARLSKPGFLRTWNLKLMAAFALSITFVIAQDPTTMMSPEIARVAGAWLAVAVDAGTRWAIAR